ncbi:glycosyltransferase [Neolewinella antarctica]|uniref:Glycosyltransferase involved in cell wall biosynthesis n=1 Tax=Neolewinella antarctica TaxID=442734 RepID=A0ABX0XF59_9BACT|nr:glycosyltransferase [Neolewinella antarctica]NJC27544.1 glycosyltransferase involved in cell wall biosynthesis [Neolewinella antarctica]
MDVSVIIPSYRHPHKIGACVDSLLDQTYTGEYEIIIVDSSPADVQLELDLLFSDKPRIKLIKLNTQTYPGTARNVGIHRAKGAVIALIDADCIAEKDWLENIVKNIADNTIITGVIENGTPDSVYGTCSFLVEFNHFLDLGKGRVELEGAATCNFACNREVFERVGYFTDDRAFEDILFCKKLIAVGGRIVKVDDVRIRHVNKTDLAGVASNLEMLGRYSALVRKRQGMPPRIIFNYPILSFGLIVFRYVSIISRVARSRYLLQFIMYTPVILYLLFIWARGFNIGAKE